MPIAISLIEAVWWRLVYHNPASPVSADRSALSLVAIAILVTSGGIHSRKAAAESLEEVSVTGTRLKVAPANLAQSVTVLDKEQIRMLSAARLEDILSQVSGTYVDSPGSTGGYSSMYVRGGESSHLLVLIDGIKMNDPTTTRGSTYDLSAIDVSQIERIELLRGAASAVYGDEALAGVLNIVTVQGRQPGLHGSAYAGLGEDDYSRFGGRLAFGSGLAGAELGFASMRDGSPSDDAMLRLDTITAGLRLDPGPVDAEISVRHSDRESLAFPDDSGGPRLAVNRERTARDAQDTAVSAQLTGGVASGLHVKGGASWYERREFSDNAFIDAGVRFPVPAFVNDTEFRRTSAHLVLTHDWAMPASLAAGLEVQREDGSLASFGDFFFTGDPVMLTFALERSMSALFAEARFDLTPMLSVQAGLRRDDVEGLAAETSPSFGLVWTLPDRVTQVKVAAGEGFKPPSFFALGFPIGANPDLLPEKSRNMEMSLSSGASGGLLTGQVSLFRTEYRNLVDFDAATFTYVNRGRIDVNGVEANLALQLGSRLQAGGGVTLLDIDESDGMPPLRNRPERKLALNFRYDLDDRVTLFARWSDTAEFIDRSNPTGDIEMPGYSRVDAGCSLQTGRFSVTMNIDNLFNNAYEQFVGFPAVGRRARIELRADF